MKNSTKILIFGTLWLIGLYIFIFKGLMFMIETNNVFKGLINVSIGLIMMYFSKIKAYNALEKFDKE